MKTKFFSVLAAATTFAGVVAITGSANAASLSSTASSNYSLTDIIDTPLSIQKFDSNLGQLNSVTIDFTSDLLGDASFTNTGAQASKVKVNLGADINLNLNNQTLFTLNPNKTYSYNAPTLQENPNQPIKIPGLTTTVNQTQTFTNSDLLQSFIGTGNLDLLFTAIAQSYVSGGGNLDASIKTQAKASVNVTYDYDQKPKKVPEPSALLGVGLVAGFGLLSLKNRSFSKA